MITTILNQFVDKAGAFNPQLFRELKSRLTIRNLALVSGVAILGQMAFIFFFSTLLPVAKDPDYKDYYNRYCLGSPPPNREGYQQPHSYIPDNYCVQDFLGNWIVNWRLWWLDFFTTLSVIGIAILLVVGTYLLVTDLTKEETRGTLNFIRLSPQSAETIFLGKLLGVPSLLYVLTVLTIPLHLITGLMAGIPLGLIVAFYGVLIAGCAFFFHIALLMGLVQSKAIAVQSFVVSGSLLFFLFLLMSITLWGEGGGFHSSLDWISFFYPGKILVYLAQATYLPFKTVSYLKESSLTGLRWYGQPIFAHAWSGITFILFNYGIWTYALTRAINRRFRRPHSVWLNKKQGYGLTLGFIVINLGFVAQSTNASRLYQNFIVLQIILFVFFAILTLALSPQRQTLQDWSRYRHQFHDNPRSGIQDLIWGEKSPSTIAIAINAAIVFLYTLPAIIIFPLNSHRFAVLGGLLLGLTMITLYSLIFQELLLLKNSRRFITAIACLSVLILVPMIAAIFVGGRFSVISSLWFATFIPMVAGERIFSLGAGIALLGQWITIFLIGGKMTHQLKQLGNSEMKRLMLGRAEKS
ncbi:MAG: hypothetical protein VKJ02_15640 [Snowella sp.]|nr:hypothetical protein [Snowella sp.]